MHPRAPRARWRPLLAACLGLALALPAAAQSGSPVDALRGAVSALPETQAQAATEALDAAARSAMGLGAGEGVLVSRVTGLAAGEEVAPDDHTHWRHPHPGRGRAVARRRRRATAARASRSCRRRCAAGRPCGSARAGPACSSP